MTHLLPPERQPAAALLVGVDFGLPNFDGALEELGLLAQTAGLRPVARLTCKRKTDRPSKGDGPGQGVVAWDVQVTNQDGALVASYDILTLVAKRTAP